jgi:hypothetical protein
MMNLEAASGGSKALEAAVAWTPTHHHIIIAYREEEDRSKQ